MVLTGYYNNENQTIIIIKKTVTNPTVITNDNITILKDKEEVVGVNIKKALDVESHIIDVNDYIDIVGPIFEIEKAKSPFVYGYIKSCEKHPKSEKLQICQVDINETNDIQIVCGAANCEAGTIAIVAQVGAVMPTGLEIKPSQLIGIDSTGMLCSYKELGIASEMKSGIALFEKNDKEIGTRI